MREKNRIRGRLYYAKNKERTKERCRAYIANNPEKAREIWRNKNWNAKGFPYPTRPEPDVCECCGKENVLSRSGKKQSLCLDHDHITNEFRGWLCNVCNTSIGKLGDNIQGLQRAIEYLNKTSKREHMARHLQ